MTERRGKMKRAATYAMMYGAGNAKVCKTSGLSIRRVKTLRKKLEL